MKLKRRRGSRIVNRPYTSIGHEFYRAFRQNGKRIHRQSGPLMKRPSARWGSWITYITTVNQDAFPDLLFPMQKRFRENRRLRISANRGSIKSPTTDQQTLLSTSDLARDDL